MKLIHPSNIIVSGPTGSGKTQFVTRLLELQLLDPFPSRIVYLYSEWQDAYNKLLQSIPSIEFVKGFPERLIDLFSANKTNLLILDDQMSKAGDTKELADLFTKGSHHRNLTIIYIVQNMFDKSKSMRTASLNAQYLIVFKSPRDKTVVQHLANQMFPKNTKFLVEAFDDATNEAFGYLVVDLRQDTPEEFRIRTKIFPGMREVAYVPAHGYKSMWNSRKRKT